MYFTHWGRVTHIRVSKLTIIGLDNGLAPARRQTIIWTNDGILLIGPLRTNSIEILIGIQKFSFKKMHLKMSYAKWRPFCLGLNVLTLPHWVHRRTTAGNGTFKSTSGTHNRNQFSVSPDSCRYSSWPQVDQQSIFTTGGDALRCPSRFIFPTLQWASKDTNRYVLLYAFVVIIPLSLLQTEIS